MSIWNMFTRRAAAREIPFDPEAYEAELNARLAARREKRPAHREAAKRGWHTRRTA